MKITILFLSIFFDGLTELRINKRKTIRYNTVRNPSKPRQQKMFDGNNFQSVKNLIYFDGKENQLINEIPSKHRQNLTGNNNMYYNVLCGLSSARQNRQKI